MVALAIRQMEPTSKFTLYSFSAGTNWGYPAVSLLPNLLDNLIAMGFGSMQGIDVGGMEIAYFHCEQDELCQSMIGSNVSKVMNDILDQLFGAGKKINNCMEQLKKFASQEFDGSLNENIESLTKFINFRLIHTNLQKNYPDVTFIQLYVLFLKALGDCKHPENFTQDVLRLIEELKASTISCQF